MIDQEYFFNKLNSVSIANFKVPVNSLLRHELYKHFATKDDSFDMVCDFMLNNNTDITYFNMKNLFEKFSKNKEKVEEQKPLKYADTCEHRECNTCEIDVCGPVIKSFSKETDLWEIDQDTKKVKEAIDRLQKEFPLLNWTFNKIKGVSVDANNRHTYLYESVGSLPEVREQDTE